MAEMPSDSSVPGMRRWVLMSGLYSTTLWPTGWIPAPSSEYATLLPTSERKPKMTLRVQEHGGMVRGAVKGSEPLNLGHQGTAHCVAEGGRTGEGSSIESVHTGVLALGESPQTCQALYMDEATPTTAQTPQHEPRGAVKESPLTNLYETDPVALQHPTTAQTHIQHVPWCYCHLSPVLRDFTSTMTS